MYIQYHWSSLSIHNKNYIVYNLHEYRVFYFYSLFIYSLYIIYVHYSNILTSICYLITSSRESLMFAFRLLLSLSILFFSLSSLVFADQAEVPINQRASSKDKKESSSIDYLWGGKIGYSGVVIDSIENKTIGKKSNIYDDFLSSMVMVTFAGVQYTFLPKFAMRGELEYVYRLDVTSLKDNEYNYLNPPSGNGTTSTKGTVDVSFQSHIVLANCYLDYYITPKVAIYAGFGVGLSILNTSVDAYSPPLTTDASTPDADNTKVDFAWQMGLGSRYSIVDNVIFDFNVRYIGITISDIALGNTNLLRMQHGLVGAVEVLVGIAHKF